MNFDTLAARALNNAWVTHKPTYAGLRLFLNSVSDEGKLLSNYIPRRLKNRTSWRYFGYQITKEINANGMPDYRNCIVGSPLTLLAESHILAEMAKESAFVVPDCAYSYRWPKSPNCGRNFEYFFDGYQKRNIAVESLLSENSQSIAIVLDIKRFYPLIDTTKLRARIDTRLATMTNVIRRDAIRQFTFGMLDLNFPKTSHGIPIGPDLSHVLGHLALGTVDDAMSKRFGSRYLRNVDDMIIVCDKSASKESIQFLNGLLEAEGLSLNEAKNDVVSATSWKENCHATRELDVKPSFDQLTTRIIRFFIKYPAQVDVLMMAFRSAGFSIPLGRLRSLAKSSRYHSYLGLSSLFSRLLSRFTGSSDSVAELIAFAVRVRIYYQAELDGEAGKPFAKSSMLRRWQVQRWRRLISRMMYLQPIEAYGTLLTKVPEIEDLAEVRAVLGAVSTGDCTPLLRMPGRAVSTFAQIWQATGRQPPKLHLNSITPNRAIGGAVCDLTLMLASDVSPMFSSSLLNQELPGTSLLVDVCTRNSKPLVTPIPQSYLDEQALLFNGHNAYEVMQLFTTRHDEREDMGFEALSLAGGISGLETIFAPYF